MNAPDPTRSSLVGSKAAWWEPLCLLLAVAVFAWGTAYKLSLYRPDQHSAPAKVCTRGSDAARSGLDHAVSARRVVQTPVLLAPAPVTDLPKFAFRTLVVASETRKPSFSPLSSLRIRPPPPGLSFGIDLPAQVNRYPAIHPA